MPAGSTRAAVAAVTFLTRVPVGRTLTLDGSDVARAAPLFPVVGVAIGAAVGGVALLFDRALPASASAAIAIAVGVVLTGALHLDALGDVADAAGASSRERALEIMRDSRIGAFAAAAIALDLLLKVIAVSALLDRGGSVRALAASAALARAAGPALATVLPYPRAGGGPGSVLTGRVRPLRSSFGVAAALGVAALLVGWTGLAMAGGVAATVVVLGVIYRRWLRGATGDCIGAAIELGETVSLLVAVALA